MGIHNQWRAMVQFYKEGKAKAIGVSNYCKNCYDHCLLDADFDVLPHIHQISYHLGMGKDSQGFVSHAKKHNMTIQAYSTLANKPKYYFWEPTGLNRQILTGNAFGGKLGELRSSTTRRMFRLHCVGLCKKGLLLLPKARILSILH